MVNTLYIYLLLIMTHITLSITLHLYFGDIIVSLLKLRPHPVINPVQICLFPENDSILQLTHQTKIAMLILIISHRKE